MLKIGIIKYMMKYIKEKLLYAMCGIFHIQPCQLPALMVI